MKKNKIICVLALVLVLCFTWVSFVSASDLVIIYDRSYLYEVLANMENNTYNNVYDGSLNYNNYNYDVIFTLNKVYLQSSTTYVAKNNIAFNLLPGMALPSGFIFVNYHYTTYKNFADIHFDLNVFLLDDTVISLNEGSDFYITKITTPLVSSMANVSNANYANVIYLFTFNENLIFDVGVGSIQFCYNLSSSVSNAATDSFLGFLVREDGILYNATYAGSGITPEQYQAIIDGIEDIGTKMEEQNESLFTPEASDTDVIAEASSQKDKFDGVMSEYSSLNEALDRPDVNELLPDYSSVVGGYKDDDFYDVFDVFYGNGYIMFMLLASVFFATMSFVIFGKKA